MKKQLLKEMNFVFLLGGRVRLGTENPLPCKLEGYRKNETPIEFEICSFWICKHCVTNKEYEQYDQRHCRPMTFRGDKYPVTNVITMNAISYARWLSEKYEINFNLRQSNNGFSQRLHSDMSILGEWIIPEKKHMFLIQNLEGCLEVIIHEISANSCGLFHISGNVQEFVLGIAYAPGTNGASVDGMYFMVKGEVASHCPRSAGVNRRGNIKYCCWSGAYSGFRLVVSP